jgi:hypothetical protein
MDERRGEERRGEERRGTMLIRRYLTRVLVRMCIGMMM